MKAVVNRVTDKIVDRLLTDKAIDSTEAEAYRFGVEIMCLKAVHIISYVLIAALMNKIPEFLVIFGVLSIFRKNTGGFHAKTRIGCYFFSCGVIIAGLCLSGAAAFIRPWMAHCLAASCLILMWILTPVENRNRRLDLDEIRFFKHRQAWSSVIFVILYLIIRMAVKDVGLPYFMVLGLGLNTVLTVMGKLQH